MEKAERPEKERRETERWEGERERKTGGGEEEVREVEEP